MAPVASASTSPAPASSSSSLPSYMHSQRNVEKVTDPDGLVLEGWAQGYMVGSLIIMMAITIANMRKGVLLHKLILLELFLGIWHGFWILLHDPAYAWWLSISAIPLNISWSLHNVIAWMKIKPFLSKPFSLLFIVTVILAQPYWVLEIYANFAYFHNVNTLFLSTRPYEALCRDPWWILMTIMLFWNIKTRYELSYKEILRLSPRFAVLLGALAISICFIILDVLSVTETLSSSLPVGINPFWKLSFVFKCLTDSIVLDDFKTALDRLRAFKISRIGSFSVDNSDARAHNDGRLEDQWAAELTPRQALALPHPDAPPDFLNHHPPQYHQTFWARKKSKVYETFHHHTKSSHPNSASGSNSSQQHQPPPPPSSQPHQHSPPQYQPSPVPTPASVDPLFVPPPAHDYYSSRPEQPHRHSHHSRESVDGEYARMMREITRDSISVSGGMPQRPDSAA